MYTTIKWLQLNMFAKNLCLQVTAKWFTIHVFLWTLWIKWMMFITNQGCSSSTLFCYKCVFKLLYNKLNLSSDTWHLNTYMISQYTYDISIYIWYFIISIYIRYLNIYIQYRVRKIFGHCNNLVMVLWALGNFSVNLFNYIYMYSY